MKLLCHINNDADLLQAWLDYYLDIGVSSFHFIVHGSASENAKLWQLVKEYPICIEDAYEEPFNGKEKRRRVGSVLENWHGQWVLWVDSDEFVEFPYRRLSTTVRTLEFFKANALFAPMVQRLTCDGTLNTPETIPDPFRKFPLCSVDLYRKMGVEAEISKYPLFYCHDRTEISDGGNHSLPNGISTVLSPLRGVTHHFKWRGSAVKKIVRRAESTVPWRHESIGYLKYLESHDFKLPTSDAYHYLREELFRRGLLRKADTRDVAFCMLRKVIGYLPAPLRNAISDCRWKFQQMMPKPGRYDEGDRG